MAQTDPKPAVVKVSTGGRVRVPDELAKEAGISDGSYVAIGVEKKKLIIQSLQLPM
ncbi:MAG: AbrB/MazE/SpoVT family DNA-binding domain-containing protein [Thaumarchaeota archaeon]|nr:AbrB/MazE/SpoVT family DNA-binding domain-containing protein [Nitrososphaerota archaeon]